MAMFNVMVQFIGPAELSDEQKACLKALGADDVEDTGEDEEGAIGKRTHYRCWVYDMAKVQNVITFAQML